MRGQKKVGELKDDLVPQEFHRGAAEIRNITGKDKYVQISVILLCS